jgi:hypothetical protein
MLTDPAANRSPTVLIPGFVAGYRVTAVLSPPQSFLALDDAGRKLVLKALPEDCLLAGRLHPSIRDRLGRVREIAHPDIANLHGVELDSPASGSKPAPKPTAYLVWDCIEGQTFTDHTAGVSDPAELAQLGRELALMVESLHALGIVHGRLHGRNVIVDPQGRLRLTHVSPLLYEEPGDDLHDLLAMLMSAVRHKKWTTLPIAAALSDGSIVSLSQLRARLAPPVADTVASDVPAGAAPKHELSSPRRRTLIAAALAMACGIAVGLGVLVSLHRAPPAPVPPDASSQAMNP